ncbi:MAG: phosphoglycerate kinase [Candidatus Anammoxibacter sp.]
MDRLFIKDINVRDKKVLVRVDFNVPFDSEGNISDDSRIRAAITTINYLLDENAKIILASHLGRPKGKVIPEFSLRPVAKRLKRLLDKDVIFIEDCIGENTKEVINKMNSGDIALLENLRFHEGEENNDPEFANEFMSLAEVFIQDAFGNCHRKHASMVGMVYGHIPKAAAGFLIKKEIDYFEKAIKNPMRPVVAILGGAKISDKVLVIENLAENVDKLLIGGAMAFTFLKALGFEVGKSLVEDSMIDTALRIMEKLKKENVKYYLPVDFVAAERFDPNAASKIVTFQEIPPDWMALDIGPASTKLFREALEDAKTILWNGPMGAFEMDAFSRGTYAMVDALVNSHALTIVGGGDTDLAFHKAGESYKVSFISTGGGAFLKLLEGKELPGIAALSEKIKD